MDRELTGLLTPRPREDVLRDVVDRAHAHLNGLPDAARTALLEDALFHERKRLEHAGPAAQVPLDALARALLRDTPEAAVDHGLNLVRAWADEIHGHFSLPAYRFASKVFPPALAALLTDRPTAGLRPDARVTVDGPTDRIRTLCREATVILAPTHVSNLDSPMIGLALMMSGLPPFQYGAGLNLFSNPIVGWWMRHLGAYTVDRTKRAQLYKNALKDYQTAQLVAHHHALFFPGGTRARSGRIETKIKKGLLGTGLQAWQENLAAGRARSEVYVVPVTLSFQLVLEASTLIDDHLAEAGQQRYIISDDEFAQPRRLAAFVGRVLRLDSAVVVRFGEPLDVLGNPVPADPAAREEATRHRRGFVLGRDGEVQWDEQRDHVYTDRLASALVAAWPRLSTVMSTHLAAWATWRCLERRIGSTDPFRLVRVSLAGRTLPRAEVLATLSAALRIAHEGAAAGRWFTTLPESAGECLAQADTTFSRYHRSRALRQAGETVVIDDPRLCLYYRNRADHLPLEIP